jgi:hypothetical protein
LGYASFFNAFEQVEASLSDADVDGPAVGGAHRARYQRLFFQAVYNARGVAGFVEHAFNKQRHGSRQRVLAAQNPQNIELGQCQSEGFEGHGLTELQPPGRVYQVDVGLLVLVAKDGLFDFVFDAHG